MIRLKQMGVLSIKRLLAVIQNAQETRGVIVLTDPDFPGDKIRHTITEHVSGVKHAYLDREKAKISVVKSVLNMRIQKILETH